MCFLDAICEVGSYYGYTENIAATFKTIMKERNMTLVEFTEKSSVARTSLQGYPKGTFNPRADIIELLSKKLNTPETVLILGSSVYLLELVVKAKVGLCPLLLPLLTQRQRFSAEIYRLTAELSKREMLEGASRNE